MKYNTDSCSEHITGGVNLYLSGCVGRLAPVCDVCFWVRARARAGVCVCLCVISNESTSKRPHCVRPQ